MKTLFILLTALVSQVSLAHADVTVKCQYKPEQYAKNDFPFQDLKLVSIPLDKKLDNGHAYGEARFSIDVSLGYKADISLSYIEKSSMWDNLKALPHFDIQGRLWKVNGSRVQLLDLQNSNSDLVRNTKERDAVIAGTDTSAGIKLQATDYMNDQLNGQDIEKTRFVAITLNCAVQK